MTKAPKPAAKKAAPAKSNGESKPAKAAAVAAPAEAKASEEIRIEAPQPQPGAQPTMRILGQYLKDLSFENPHAPQSLAPQTTQPDINISVNVNARNLATSDYEV